VLKTQDPQRADWQVAEDGAAEEGLTWTLTKS